MENTAIQTSKNTFADVVHHKSIHEGHKCLFSVESRLKRQRECTQLLIRQECLFYYQFTRIICFVRLSAEKLTETLTIKYESEVSKKARVFWKQQSEKPKRKGNWTSIIQESSLQRQPRVTRLRSLCSHLSGEDKDVEVFCLVFGFHWFPLHHLLLALVTLRKYLFFSGKITFEPFFVL